MREKCFYWIRYDNEADVEVAEWWGERWWSAGYDDWLKEDLVVVLSDRLVPPEQEPTP